MELSSLIYSVVALMFLLIGIGIELNHETPRPDNYKQVSNLTTGPGGFKKTRKNDIQSTNNS